MGSSAHCASCNAFVGATLAVARGRGNHRSAAGGGRREAISRKCPDWRPRQWPGIGWHNGGQESPSPTHHKETHRSPCKKPVIAKPVRTLAVAIRNSKDPTRQKRPAPGRSFSNIPYITMYPLPRLILTPLEDLQNIVEMALLLFQLRLFLRGNALRRLLGGLLCLRGSLSGHRL